MKNLKFLALLLLVFFALINSANSQEADSKNELACKECESLLSLKLPDVEIINAVESQDENAHCLLKGIIGKEIYFELILPKKWNSRFVMSGNGGFAGGIHNQFRYVHKEGYAWAGTNTGHTGNVISGEWALNNIERQMNYGSQGIHLTTVVAKFIIEHFYNQPLEFSYFLGQSGGGRQALIEAQKYPEDFDGILCGFPVADFTAWTLEGLDIYRKQFPESASEGIISQEKLKLLSKIVMDQFDELDGIIDNIISNPEDHTLNLTKLPLCKDDSDKSNCFTKSEIDIIESFYEGLVIDGKEVFPGFPVGSEQGWGGVHLNEALIPQMKDFDQKTIMGAFSAETYKHFVYNDSSWNIYSENISDCYHASKHTASILNATSTDYSVFKDIGGKMIIYHGWSDQNISAYSTIDHYSQILSNDPEANDYIRLFLIPSFMHGVGGVGPTIVDWVSILQEWVENGIPPNRITSKKYNKAKITMARPLFPYPSIAKYDGKGDPNKESSFIELKK